MDIAPGIFLIVAALTAAVPVPPGGIEPLGNNFGGLGTLLQPNFQLDPEGFTHEIVRTLDDSGKTLRRVGDDFNGQMRRVIGDPLNSASLLGSGFLPLPLGLPQAVTNFAGFVEHLIPGEIRNLISASPSAEHQTSGRVPVPSVSKIITEGTSGFLGGNPEEGLADFGFPKLPPGLPLPSPSKIIQQATTGISGLLGSQEGDASKSENSSSSSSTENSAGQRTERSSLPAATAQEEQSVTTTAQPTTQTIAAAVVVTSAPTTTGTSESAGGDSAATGGSSTAGSGNSTTANSSSSSSAEGKSSSDSRK